MPQTVLITGASSGIGEATARHFLAAGWNVAAAMRTPGRSTLGPESPRLLVVPIDVTRDETIAAAVDAVVQRFGAIDVLINNAGYALLGPLEALTPDQFRRQVDTNLLGLVAVTQQVLPTMRACKAGVIVNIASIGGRMAFPFAAAYHATKFAVEGLSESMRFELRPLGIRVKVIEPGPIRTNFLGASTDWAEHEAYKDDLKKFRTMSDRMNAGLPAPDIVAKTIFRAATDGTERLRYPVANGPIPWLHRILPDAVWRGLLRLELERRSK
ncbi:MAG TPA: SDR family oxidoreductase [Alphaproteobacteria bacterium]|nr:SDR family oxidoreductase [Alphaproteobacteria bacterium]